MNRLFSLVMICAFFSAFSQVTNDVYVRVNGKLLSSEDSSTIIGATLNYEKLPYYDDMGIGSSKDGGAFEFYLIEGLKYNFSVRKEGFIDLTQEVSIVQEGEAIMDLTLYMNPIPKEPEPELITLDNLIFARGSDRITPQSYNGLDELVDWLDERPGMVIQLEGHTDFAGNADANMRLSQARVDAVKEYLTGKGVKKARVLTKAFGGSQPLSQERTDEARALNRRVEVRVISR